MRKIRILMVEDETDVLKINQMHLERQGYETWTARTIREARNILWEYPPDLILLDVMMPDGTGWDFCEEIRKQTTAPVIFLTCIDTADQIVHGLLRGADDYITKPYNLDVLSARISAQLRRSGILSGGIIHLPPLHIDLHTGKVTLNDKNIVLAQKEMQLLAFFAENAGREFSTDAIYHSVWGDNSPVSSNTVRVHISNLRNKLKLNDASPFEIILTPNKGYVFLRTIFSKEA